MASLKTSSPLWNFRWSGQSLMARVLVLLFIFMAGFRKTSQ
jgi:hypothetical protein